MESGDLLARRRAAGDERFVRVTLTEHGDALRTHATRIHCGMKDALGLDAAEFAALQQILRALIGRVAR